MAYLNVEEIEAALDAARGVVPGRDRADRSARTRPRKAGSRTPCGSARRTRRRQTPSSSPAGCTRANGSRPTRSSTSRPTCSRRIREGPGCATAGSASRPTTSGPWSRGCSSSSSPASTRTGGTTARPPSRCGGRTGAGCGRTSPRAAWASTSTATSTRCGTSAATSPRIPRQRVGRSLPPPGLCRTGRRVGAGDAERRLAARPLSADALVRRRAQLRAGDLSHLGLRREPDVGPGHELPQSRVRRPARPGRRRVPRVHSRPRTSRRCRSSAAAMNDAISAASGTAYELGQSFSLYPTSGTSDDYAYSRHFVTGTQEQDPELHRRVRTLVPAVLGRRRRTSSARSVPG